MLSLSPLSRDAVRAARALRRTATAIERGYTVDVAISAAIATLGGILYRRQAAAAAAAGPGAPAARPAAALVTAGDLLASVAMAIGGVALALA